jgi:REP element-mobilizing transposase RayT
MARTTSQRPRKLRRPKQLALLRHGGKRRGAGRRPTNAVAGVTHAARPTLSGREPVLVTLKARREVWNLRAQRAMRALIPALFAARESLVRLVHFSVQHDHVHLVVEAADRSALSRGMQGLAVRLARALNRLMKREGKVWTERFHSHVLRTPRQVRHCLAYVLGNARKHGVPLPARGLDPCSSAAAFDGWAGRVVVSLHELARAAMAVAVPPRTWLLRFGWRRAGDLLDPDHQPGAAPRGWAAGRGF